MVSGIKSQAKFLALELGRLIIPYTSAGTLKQISDKYCLLPGVDPIFPLHSIHLNFFFYPILRLLVSPPSFDSWFRPLWAATWVHLLAPRFQPPSQLFSLHAASVWGPLLTKMRRTLQYSLQHHKNPNRNARTLAYTPL